MSNRSHAFSLVEVLAAVAIIGVVTFLAMPNIVQMKQDSEDNLARARAETLNMAIASYIQANGAAAAQTSWAAGDNASRYLLLTPYVAFSESTLAAFEPAGYDFTLPASINPLSQKTTISAGSRGQIYY